MSPSKPRPGDAAFADEIQLTLSEFCHVCRVPQEEVLALVLEGVLEPSGPRREEWTFAASSIRRAQIAFRIGRDLEVNLAGIALALDLLDDIAALRARLDAVGPGGDEALDGDAE